MLKALLYIFGFHIIINTAPIYCNLLMYPLNKLTGVYCINEAGGIEVNGKPKRPNTIFERIVSGQLTWPWMLFGLFIPNPITYYCNIYIIGSTIYAYPASLMHILNIC